MTAVENAKEIDLDALRKIVCDQLEVEPEQVTMEASFIDDLKADSLDLVELIMALEETYGVVVSDQDAEGIRTVGDALAFVQAHRAAAG
jgi:acyl carrier protein